MNGLHMANNMAQQTWWCLSFTIIKNYEGLIHRLLIKLIHLAYVLQVDPHTLQLRIQTDLAHNIIVLGHHLSGTVKYKHCVDIYLLSQWITRFQSLECMVIKKRLR
jgi:hypothetical protein